MALPSSWTDPDGIEQSVNTKLETTKVNAILGNQKQLGGTAGWIGARAYHSANQSINSGTVTALALNSERYDSSSFHDLAVANSRMTIPSGMVGVYEISGHISWAGAASGVQEVLIRHNGASYIAINSLAASGSAQYMSLSTSYLLGEGDYVELMVYQTSGGAVNVMAEVNYSPELAIKR